MWILRGAPLAQDDKDNKSFAKPVPLGAQNDKDNDEENTLCHF